MLGTCWLGWEPPDYKCVKTQDIALIESRIDGDRSGFTYDSLVARIGNNVTRCIVGDPLRNPLLLIGSQSHKVKFPAYINIQLFLRKVPLQSLGFEIPENSMLIFYNSYECMMMSDSTVALQNIYQEKGRFYRDVQRAVDDGVFIDSSRSESACWMMKQINEDYYEQLRCTKVKDGSYISNIETCVNM
jgi:hypothetical protein